MVDHRNKYPPATRAGDVFKEVYETTLNYMHPEDALHTSFEATLRYLENIGATRPKKKQQQDMPEIKVKQPGRVKPTTLEPPAYAEGANSIRDPKTWG